MTTPPPGEAGWERRLEDLARAQERAAELRESIAEASHVGRTTALARGVLGDWNIHLAVADEILARREVAPLLEAHAAVRRVEALATDWQNTWFGRQLRRALGSAG